MNPSATTPFQLPDDLGQDDSLILSPGEFGEIRALVHDNFGIHLAEKKQALVVSRLQKHLREKGFGSFAQYIAHVRCDQSGRALSDLANRITTNHTYFFREEAHFSFFRDTVLPQMAEICKRSGKKDLRIWCAGCSTGEEAYTLAILIREFLGKDITFWDAGVLATDISLRALETAKGGVYSEERIQRMPAEWKSRYFKKIAPDRWEVDDCLKKEITFRRFNLINRQFPFRLPFHIIFCRNVMIYFERETRETLVRRFYQHTIPEGYLFVGHSEALGRDTCPYGYVQPAVYRKGAKD